MRWLVPWFRFDIVREARAREYVLSRTVKTESLDLKNEQLGATRSQNVPTHAKSDLA